MADLMHTEPQVIEYWVCPRNHRAVAGWSQESFDERGIIVDPPPPEIRCELREPRNRDEALPGAPIGVAFRTEEEAADAIEWWVREFADWCPELLLNLPMQNHSAGWNADRDLGGTHRTEYQLAGLEIVRKGASTILRATWRWRLAVKRWHRRTGEIDGVPVSGECTRWDPIDDWREKTKRTSWEIEPAPKRVVISWVRS